jgi:hypothetical protein
MPNWCNNHFTISHSDPMMLEKMVQASIAEKLGETFVPIPDSVRDNSRDFCVDNWGTKWDFGCKEISTFGDDIYSGYFDTAWAPPVEWYIAMSEIGFRIEAHWHEGGYGFAGSFIDGEVTEYNNLDCDSFKELPWEFDELFGLHEQYQPEEESFDSEDIP